MRGHGDVELFVLGGAGRPATIRRDPGNFQFVAVAFNDPCSNFFEKGKELCCECKIRT